MGALLGPLRQFLLVPAVGEAVAVAIELPLVLAACWWLAGQLAAGTQVRARWGMGLVGLLVLVALDLALGLWVRGGGLAGWAGRFATPPGLLTALGYAVFAALPRLRLRPGGDVT